jgi:hypothetical protein
MKTGIVEAVAAAILLTAAAIAALPKASPRGIVAKPAPNPAPWRSAPLGMEGLVLPSRAASNAVTGFHSGPGLIRAPIHSGLK